MGRDSMKAKRIEAPIPVENTLLIETLKEQSALTGITEGKLLVQYATAYLMQQGSIAGGTFPATPLTQEDTRQTGPLAAVPQTPVTPSAAPFTEIDTFTPVSGPADDDFDAFGDPD